MRRPAAWGSCFSSSSYCWFWAASKTREQRRSWRRCRRSAVARHADCGERFGKRTSKDGLIALSAALFRDCSGQEAKHIEFTRGPDIDLAVGDRWYAKLNAASGSNSGARIQPHRKIRRVESIEHSAGMLYGSLPHHPNDPIPGLLGRDCRQTARITKKRHCLVYRARA